MTAYVLVQTDTQNGQIASRIREVPGIVFAEDVRGPYDALALVRSDQSGQAFQRALDQIRQLPGVIHALAAPIVQPSFGRSERHAA